jgi:phage tail sheath protein FI
VIYLASGADGTATTTNSHWDYDNAAFNNLPVRLITNCETTDVTTQKNLETYCKARWDNPKVIYNVASSQSKAQLITIGNNYQRGDDVMGVIQEKWYKVTDPFASSALAPYRSIPSVGHVMGAWIRAMGLLGIHWSPSTVNTPINGIQDVVGTQFVDAGDRTDLAEAGVNTTMFEPGNGWLIKTFYTPSTQKAYWFAKGILMRSYIMVSVRDSQLITQNEPNSFKRILDAASAIKSFYYQLWLNGSTGSVPEGETFGQSENSDGSLTKFEDHVYVQADLINNPQSSVDAGNRNLDSWFTFPADAASIKIGVGLMLR